MICSAIEATSEGASKGVTLDTNLSEEEILDSLDLMNFLFELEDLHGSKIEEITETYDDYRVKTLVSFLVKER